MSLSWASRKALFAFSLITLDTQPRNKPLSMVVSWGKGSAWLEAARKYAMHHLLKGRWKGLRFHNIWIVGCALACANNA